MESTIPYVDMRQFLENDGWHIAGSTFHYIDHRLKLFLIYTNNRSTVQLRAFEDIPIEWCVTDGDHPLEENPLPDANFFMLGNPGRDCTHSHGNGAPENIRMNLRIMQAFGYHPIQRPRRFPLIIA